jgi:hypothetical protein
MVSETLKADTPNAVCRAGHWPGVQRWNDQDQSNREIARYTSPPVFSQLRYCGYCLIQVAQRLSGLRLGTGTYSYVVQTSLTEGNHVSAPPRPCRNRSRAAFRHWRARRSHRGCNCFDRRSAWGCERHFPHRGWQWTFRSRDRASHLHDGSPAWQGWRGHYFRERRSCAGDIGKHHVRSPWIVCPRRHGGLEL